jgi:hypothetical protein
MNTLHLHSCHINYDNDAKEGVIFLENHLDLKEFETLFGYAKDHREAFFQDREGHHYEIEYKSEQYFLIKK